MSYFYNGYSCNYSCFVRCILTPGIFCTCSNFCLRYLTWLTETKPWFSQECPKLRGSCQFTKICLASREDEHREVKWFSCGHGVCDCWEGNPDPPFGGQVQCVLHLHQLLFKGIRREKKQLLKAGWLNYTDFRTPIRWCPQDNEHRWKERRYEGEKISAQCETLTTSNAARIRKSLGL